MVRTLQLAACLVLSQILCLLGRDDLRDHRAHFTSEELESKGGYNLLVIKKKKSLPPLGPAL